MTDLRKAAEMALKALDYEAREEPESIWIAEREALRQALAPEVTPEVAKRKTLAELLSATPEVVAVSENGIRTVKQTPKKEWVGLTEEEIFQAYKPEMEGMPFNKPTLAVIAGYIEAKLKEKNT